VTVTQADKRPVTGGKALVALGSNATSRFGAPRETLLKALEVLDDEPCRVVRASGLFLTPFVPAGGGDDVINAAVLLETGLDAKALLAHLHAIEAAFDRDRAERWANRTLDLDLIAMGERVLPDRDTLELWINMPPEAQKRDAPDGLVLPHPRLQDRAFVLVPAAEVAPGWRHPLTGLSIEEMRDALPAEDVAAVRPLAV